MHLYTTWQTFNESKLGKKIKQSIKLLINEVK